MENRVDVQEMYDQAYSLMDGLRPLYAQHDRWAQWSYEFKKCIDNIFGKNGKARDANNMLHGVGPDEKGLSPSLVRE